MLCSKLPPRWALLIDVCQHGSLSVFSLLTYEGSKTRVLSNLCWLHLLHFSLSTQIPVYYSNNRVGFPCPLCANNHRLLGSPCTYFLSPLPHLTWTWPSFSFCLGRGDCSEGVEEEGDTHSVLPVGRHIKGPSALWQSLGAFRATQCQNHAFQSPATPSKQGVPRVCWLLWAVA